jgi:hypothetical protein
MRSLIVISAALAALALPAAAMGQGSTPRPVAVGIGEPHPDMFDDARFRATGIRHARVIVPYDLVDAGGWPLAVTDLWLSRARRDGVEPLVSFSHSFVKRRKLRLPSVREYSRRVAEFRARYPWVREFSTWNEANHKGTQPTGRHPRRAAVYYRALKRQCAGCTVLAVEVLLTHSWKTWRWIRRFRERAGRGPHIFGLHNYPDVTRLRSLNTRLFLRRVPRARVWLTETGGVVRFGRWKHNEGRAARAVRHVFRMTSRLPRVERVYFYNWRADDNRRWDSGLISREGTERMGYYRLLEGLTLDRFRPVPVPIDEPIAKPLPGPNPGPGDPIPDPPPDSDAPGGPD